MKYVHFILFRLILAGVILSVRTANSVQRNLGLRLVVLFGCVVIIVIGLTQL